MTHFNSGPYVVGGQSRLGFGVWSCWAGQSTYLPLAPLFRPFFRLLLLLKLREIDAASVLGGARFSSGPKSYPTLPRATVELAANQFDNETNDFHFRCIVLVFFVVSIAPP